MRRILAALAIALAAGAAAPGRADDRDILMSQIYLSQGNVEHALEAINSAIDDDPDYAPAYLIRAEAWWARGEYRKAGDDYSQAIAHGLDHSPYVYTQRGSARAAAGDYAAAIADYSQALTINPGFWPAIAGRGAALAESGDAARGLADLDRALARDPGDIKEVLSTEHVQVQSRKGPPQQGTNSVTVTIHAQPMLVETYAARGKLRFAQGAYKPALADLDEALKRLPAFPAAHFYRGLTLLALGRCREGQDEFQAEGVRGTALFQAALAQHHDVVAKAGCAAQKL